MTQAELKTTELLNLLKTERPLLEDGLKLLTFTQQHEYRFIGGADVKATLNGLYGLMKNTTSFTVSEKTSSNDVMKDVKIKLVMNEDAAKATGLKNRKLQCRLVKESGLRNADVNGQWGVNISSFKFLDA